ncbi:Cof-type HAD-IIB family hydrolase [Clostridium sp.]|uniref:Cof-type HAD-IIB family hydrolase n=1 Tax=Clostridium sp. TaxID=1506 RepID=UPI002636722A|nr:Cof-type HAD-IIB family hydrolase [Clostridium sp.]
MEYKLICIDMDGTLLNNKHEVSDRNKEAILKATEKGVKVAVTTGRLFTSAKFYAGLLGVKTPIISCNGAFIREKDEDRVIYESVLSDEQIERVYKIIKKYNIDIAYFNTADTVISEKIVPEEHGYKVMNKMVGNSNEQVLFSEGVDFKESFEKYKGQILKAICIENNKDNLDNLFKAKEELKKYDDLEVVSSYINNFEVMNKGTSKGNGVKVLADILHIKREEVMCLGDSENDLSMIEFAGLGVAMGNAEDFLKEKADYITDTNENDGVAKAIEKFVLI